MAADQRAWRKSSYSAQHSNCVEVAPTPRVTAIRDSKDRMGGELHLSRTAWRAFIRELTAE